MIFYLGEKVEPISQNALTRGNNNRSWEYGYDAEHDVVIVSRDGTLGEIYNINGLNIGLPRRPLRNEIANGLVPTKNQKWSRNPLPKGLNRETQHHAKYGEYITEEFRRRNEGHWHMIKGEPVWMPGTLYFFLNWVRLDEGYPDFRIIQNELMIYWEACKADRRCYGIDYVKNRRFGWTSLGIGECLNSGTVVEDKLLGLMSKSRDDSKSMFNKLVMAFKRLPCFYQPIWDGTTTPKSELLMTTPTRKKASDDAMDDEEGINTRITFYATTLNAMDGEKVFRSILDEAGKYPKECPFDRYWSIVKTSHRVGARIVGKSMVGSTVNAMSNGGLEFKEIFEQSDPNKRNPNGQTTSGLYKLFIPAQYCIENYFDQYGFSIVDDPEKPMKNEYGDYVKIGANTYIDNELEGLKEFPEAHNEYLRQFPRTEAHAFRDVATDCSFNLSKIYEQTDFNEQELAPGTIQRGNFHWRDGVQDTEVIWSPNPKGRFLMTHQPPEEFRNKWEMHTAHGVRAKKPMATHLGAFGVDPYNRSRTSKGVGSKGSIHLFTKLGNGEWPSNRFTLEYIDRPRTVELFYEDVIMAMVYHSMPILSELSNEDFLKTLKRRGYRHYSLNRPDKKWKDLSPTEQELGGVPPQGQVIGDAQYYAVEAYIEDRVGVATTDTHRGVGEMGTMHFNRTLNQWKDVDPDKRTKYDAYISSSLALLANRRWGGIKEQKPVRTYTMPFQRFDNTGKFSTVPT